MSMRRLRHDDAGFGLPEAVVAVVMLGVLVSGIVAVLMSILSTVRSNDQRVVAANLAQRQIEQVRDMLASDLPNGSTSVAQTVNGTTYTVSQTVAALSSSTSASICAGASSRIAYKSVAVTVSWPDMRAVKPVRADTLRVVGVGALPTGMLAVQVNTATGAPAAGVTVTVTGKPPTTTGTDGCAVFDDLSTASMHTVTASRAGYVGPNGTTTVSETGVAVQSGAVTRLTLDYDNAGILNATLVSPHNYPVPSGMPLTLDMSRFAPTTYRAFPECSTSSSAPSGCASGAGTARTVSHLFPGEYGAWAGSCPGSAPAATTRTAVTAGATVGRNIELADVDLRVKDTAGTTLTGATVRFKSPTDSASACNESWLVPEVRSGVYQAGLPAGTWTVSVVLGTRTTTTEVTLALGGTLPTAVTVTLP